MQKNPPEPPKPAAKPRAHTPSIHSIELLLVSVPFSAGRRTVGEESIDEFNASSQTFTQMQTLIVKVTDAQGLIGWGEAFGHKTNPASWAALQDIVAPFYCGKPADPDEVRAEAEYAFHAFGRTGPVHYALSAVDTALWDLKAQRAGVPLRHLISPQSRDQVECYASLVHYGEDPVEVAYHLQRAQQAGYRAFKLHESTPTAIAAARAQVGPDADLMTDVNCAWNEIQAAQVLDELASSNLLWLEEPVFPPDDTAALARLNATYGNISAGENASGVYGLGGQMRAGAVSVAQPSVGKIGGISAMLEIFDVARHTGIRVVPHCFYYGPGLNASAELTAVLADDVMLEVPFLQWSQRLHPMHGAGPVVQLSDRPGLGFAPDESALTEHLVRQALITGH